MLKPFYQTQRYVTSFLRKVLFNIGVIGVVFLLLVGSGNRFTSAGPWTMQKGSLYLNYSAVWTEFDKVKLHNDDTKDVGDVQFISNAASFYYGILDNLDIHAMIPYEISSREGDGKGGIKDFGDAKFGLKYRFLAEEYGYPLSLALGVEWKTPLSNYSENRLDSLGDQQDDYEFRLFLGRYFDIFNMTGYVDVEGGYRLRTGSTKDELFGFTELGMLFGSKFSGRVFVDAVNALGGLELESPRFMELMMGQGAPPFPRVGEDFVKAGLGVSFFPTDSMDIGMFWSTNVYTDNSSRDMHVGVSIGYKFW